MYRIIIFVLASIALAALSSRSLRDPRSHGFYRFFAFEAILIQILLSLPYWFDRPFSLTQLISWPLLLVSIVLAAQGFYMLRKIGGSRPREGDSANLSFENTARLVTEGPYRFIRHPLYSSLLFLAWGAFFKRPSLPGIAVTAIASIFLFLTAKAEEKENIAFFGPEYGSYMKKTKMFIPSVF